jgi:hypothetical protein
MNLIPPKALPPLHNGDRMTQAEFHRRYQAYPKDVKIELIGGTVYMPSPLRWRHGAYESKLGLALGLYEASTPGIELGANATTILGEESEPQPDLALRILPEYGGQSQENDEEYVEGAPEFLAEIAYSSRAIDMHQKRQDYQQAGVVEYLVLCVEEQELHWFDFASQSAIRPTRQGIYRSRVFPGLWIDGPALLARRSAQIIAAVQQGLASPKHAAFVKRLETARRRHKPGS